MAKVGPQKRTGELTLKYLSLFPAEKSLTLAKRLKKDYPADFTSVDHARAMIRTYRGTNGPHNRGDIKNTKFYVTNPKAEIPVSEAVPWLPYIIPPRYKKTLVIADLHIPYHDKKVLEIAIENGKGCDSVMILGDLLDFYQASRFDRVPTMTSLKGEVALGNEVLDYIQRKLKAKMFYKLGNHDEHFDRLIMTRCPELWGMDGLNLNTQLHIAERGGILIADKRPVKYSHLSLLHGHEYGGGAGGLVNPARTMFMKVRTTGLCAHSHRTSANLTGGLNPHPTVNWSIGGLCYLHPQFSVINDWNHGFALLEKDDNSFRVNNFIIIDGKVRPA